MSLSCYSCGRLCSAPRTPAWNDMGRKVWVGPDCFRNAEKGGHEGFWNEKTESRVFASEALAREWIGRNYPSDLKDASEEDGSGELEA